MSQIPFVLYVRMWKIHLASVFLFNNGSYYVSAKLFPLMEGYDVRFTPMMCPQKTRRILCECNQSESNERLEDVFTCDYFVLATVFCAANTFHAKHLQLTNVSQCPPKSLSTINFKIITMNKLSHNYVTLKIYYGRNNAEGNTLFT